MRFRSWRVWRSKRSLSAGRAKRSRQFLCLRIYRLIALGAEASRLCVPTKEPGKQKPRSCRAQELARSRAQENARQKKAAYQAQQESRREEEASGQRKLKDRGGEHIPEGALFIDYKAGNTRRYATVYNIEIRQARRDGHPDMRAAEAAVELIGVKTQST
jgi:hypothetical protein